MIVGVAFFLGHPVKYNSELFKFKFKFIHLSFYNIIHLNISVNMRITSTFKHKWNALVKHAGKEAERRGDPRKSKACKIKGPHSHYK